MSDSAEFLYDTFRKSGVIATDLLSLVIGRKIGQGVTRHVYECLLVPNTVIKVETESRRYDNIIENEIWQNFSEDKKMAGWLAPIHYISPCGVYLIQSRTQHVPARLLPEKIPRFFADTKIENWGLLNDRFVCHDYGNNKLFHGGNFSQLVKADWWSRNRYDNCIQPKEVDPNA